MIPRAPGRHTTLVEALSASFAVSLRTPEGTAEPAALLWTDADGQWEPLLAQLRTVVPHVFTLGDYVPQSRMGPAIWLRCVVDRSLPEIAPPVGTVPIIYLPRVTRQELRAAEDCPWALQPLVELQYRGRVWHQRNGRDWTVEAFLVSEDGLGLDIAQDARTREALLRALPLLVEVPVESLRVHRLDADDFDRLAVSDPVRDLLRWMAAGDTFRSGDDWARWRAFCNVCRSEFAFDPDKKSPLDAGGTMAEGSGKWADVWQRFCEAPKLYPAISSLLREVPMERFSLFTQERSPRVNDEAETRLRGELEAAARMPHGKAIDAVLALDAEHTKRREWVWAQLGESPLALALEPLARLASLARKPLGAATLEALLESYATDGWLCDRAALEAIASTRSQASAAVVRGAVKALYEPWLEATARHFQSLIARTEDVSHTLVTGTVHEKDVCVLFADGLRYDVAGLLQERLEARGFGVRLGYRLAPLPTVTATAKPLASPVHDALDGDASSEDFTPRFKETGHPATALRLRENMAKRAVDVLGSDVRPPSAGTISGWVEAGRLDELGHKLGAGLAAQLDNEIEALVDRIVGLLENGWPRVRIVTDHGWLLLPSGLPKLELPSHLVATKWARCAVMLGESAPAMPVYGWHWHPEVRIASPPGIACFTSGNEYAHGGLSLQECVVPDMLVERGAGATSATIASVQWRGMRCRVSVHTNDPMVRVDLRLNWKLPATSAAASVKEVGLAGEASIAVSDDANEGAAATVVVLDTAGNVLDRKPTTIGEAS